MSAFMAVLFACLFLVVVFGLGGFVVVVVAVFCLFVCLFVVEGGGGRWGGGGGGGGEGADYVTSMDRRSVPPERI